MIEIERVNRVLRSRGCQRPQASLRRVDIDIYPMMRGRAYENNEEVPAVAVEVVAGAVPAGGAEHRRVPAHRVDNVARFVPSKGSCSFSPVMGSQTSISLPSKGGTLRTRPWWESLHPVEVTEPAAEASAAEDAAPQLADEGSADEGVVRWEAEEELFDELVHLHQRRRRRRLFF